MLIEAAGMTLILVASGSVYPDLRAEARRQVPPKPRLGDGLLFSKWRWRRHPVLGLIVSRAGFGSGFLTATRTALMQL